MCVKFTFRNKLGEYHLTELNKSSLVTWPKSEAWKSVKKWF